MAHFDEHGNFTSNRMPPIPEFLRRQRNWPETRSTEPEKPSETAPRGLLWATVLAQLTEITRCS